MPTVGQVIKWHEGPYKGLLTKVVQVNFDKQTFDVEVFTGRRITITREIYMTHKTEMH